jgi:hypothetical protein
MVFRTHGLFKDLTAHHVAGNIWEFTQHLAGQPFVIEDSDGNVVLRDRGLVTIRVLFDTLEDSQPGGITLEVEITGVHGPQPRLSADFCAIVTRSDRRTAALNQPDAGRTAKQSLGAQFPTTPRRTRGRRP